MFYLCGMAIKNVLPVWHGNKECLTCVAWQYRMFYLCGMAIKNVLPVWHGNKECFTCVAWQ
jgi:hypothetical protein